MYNVNTMNTELHKNNKRLLKEIAHLYVGENGILFIDNLISIMGWKLLCKSADDVDDKVSTDDVFGLGLSASVALYLLKNNLPMFKLWVYANVAGQIFGLFFCEYII